MSSNKKLFIIFIHLFIILGIILFFYVPSLKVKTSETISNHIIENTKKNEINIEANGISTKNVIPTSEEITNADSKTTSSKNNNSTNTKNISSQNKTQTNSNKPSSSKSNTSSHKNSSKDNLPKNEIPSNVIE